jgi:hypothetical protein
LPGEIEIPGEGRMTGVEGLVWALGKLDQHFQRNRLNYKKNEKPPGELADKLGVAARALDKVVQALELKEDVVRFGLPRQPRAGLTYFARQEAMRTGGFPDHPPESDRITLGGEEFIFPELHEDRQLDQNIRGLFEIRRWLRQAEAVAKRASGRNVSPKEAECAQEELALSGMERGWEFDICDEIFEIWAKILGRPMRVSISRARKPTGPLIRFTQCCLKLIDHAPLSPGAIRICARRWVERDMAKSGGEKI